MSRLYVWPSNCHLGGMRPFPAITFGFTRVIFVGEGGFVVGFYDTGYVWKAAVAHFDVVSVKYFAKLVCFLESFCQLGRGIFLQR